MPAAIDVVDELVRNQQSIRAAGAQHVSTGGPDTASYVGFSMTMGGGEIGPRIDETSLLG